MKRRWRKRFPKLLRLSASATNGQYTTGLSDEERVEIAALFEEYIDRPPGEWTEAEWAVANAINDEAEADMEE